MIHILFGQSSSGTLKYVLKKLEQTQKEKVITFGEMFSVGPIWHLHKEIGIEQRIEWMKKIMSEESAEHDEYKQNYLETISQIKFIPKDELVLIWASENAYEQTGLRYVLYLLKDKTNKVKIINATKVFEKLVYQSNVQYALRATGEISPEKLQKIYEETKQLYPLTQMEREDFEEEWLMLAENCNTLRIWLDGQIKNVSEDYYDQYIIDTAKKLHDKQNIKEFIKAPRLIGEVLGNVEQYLTDGFLEYRLKKMIEKEIFESNGSLKGIRDYGIILKS
ncbi:MAG: DUF1835 domain-containing protein [Proteocatella sp.]